MDNILTVAFIVACVAFFKKQFELNGKVALILAFAIALFIGLMPVLGTYFPAATPVFEVLAKTFTLFLSAAGGYDALVDLHTKAVG